MSSELTPLPPQEPSYPRLHHPGEMRSQIPEHLLQDTSKAQRFIMEQLDINRQSNEWLVRASLTHNANILHTNGRLLKAEATISELKDDKKTLLSGWKLLVALVIGVSGFISAAWTIYKALTGKP